MSSQIGAFTFQQTLRTHTLHRLSDAQPSEPSAQRSDTPSHLSSISQTRQIADLSALASSLEEIAHKHARNEKLLSDVVHITTEIDEMKDSAGADTKPLDNALSSLQTLDESLKTYQQSLSVEADTLSRPAANPNSSNQALKQASNEITTEQVATKTALLKQTAAVYMKGFAGLSGLLPILFD